MDKNQFSVMEFHEKFGVTVGAYPELRDRELRAKLILEEAVETVAALGFTVAAEIREPIIWADEAPPVETEADEFDPGYTGGGVVAHFEKTFEKPDFNEVIDGLADLEYVLKGAAVVFGIDLQPFFEEVHRSNMAKDGGATRADGKILKPEGWQPPDIDTILIRQQNAADMWREMEQAALDDNDSPMEVINAAESAA